jgi:hypothetical protein
MDEFLDYFVPITAFLVGFIPLIILLWDGFVWLIDLPMLHSWVVWSTARILAVSAYTMIAIVISAGQ